MRLFLKSIWVTLMCMVVIGAFLPFFITNWSIGGKIVYLFFVLPIPVTIAVFGILGGDLNGKSSVVFSKIDDIFCSKFKHKYGNNCTCSKCGNIKHLFKKETDYNISEYESNNQIVKYIGTCSRCRSIKIMNTFDEVCDVCGGSGNYTTERAQGGSVHFDIFYETHTCDKCNQTGKITIEKIEIHAPLLN